MFSDNVFYRFFFLLKISSLDFFFAENFLRRFFDESFFVLPTILLLDFCSSPREFWWTTVTMHFPWNMVKNSTTSVPPAPQSSWNRRIAPKAESCVSGSSIWRVRCTWVVFPKHKWIRAFLHAFWTGASEISRWTSGWWIWTTLSTSTPHQPVQWLLCIRLLENLSTCTVFAKINAHPEISAHQKQWFFQGGSTQNRWLLVGDFPKGGVHKTDSFWWVILQRGEYTKPMGCDGWFFKGGSTQNRWILVDFGNFFYCF